MVFQRLNPANSPRREYNLFRGGRVFKAHRLLYQL